MIALFSKNLYHLGLLSIIFYLYLPTVTHKKESKVNVTKYCQNVTESTAN